MIPLKMKTRCFRSVKDHLFNLVLDWLGGLQTAQKEKYSIQQRSIHLMQETAISARAVQPTEESSGPKNLAKFPVRSIFSCLA